MQQEAGAHDWVAGDRLPHARAERRELQCGQSWVHATVHPLVDCVSCCADTGSPVCVRHAAASWADQARTKAAASSNQALTVSCTLHLGDR
jgi:hypothetical protein